MLARFAKYNGQVFIHSRRSASSYNDAELVQLSMEKDARCVVYPNPNTGDFVIEGNENFEIVNLRIVDLQGKTIPFTHYRIGDLTVHIDLKTADNGIYLVQVTNQMNQLQTLRIIKK